MTPSLNLSHSRIGIALSGGGVRGFAHVGALKALEDVGIRPSVIAGVSAGSVVAAFYASGLMADDIYGIFNTVDFKQFVQVDMSRSGFFKLDRFMSFLHETLPVPTFDRLSIPLRVGVTNISRQEAAVFTDGELAPRLTASCSIPTVFKPIEIEGEYYVDGGVTHNLPAFCLKEHCDYLIGINVSPSLVGDVKLSIPSLAYRSYKTMTMRNVTEDKLLCDTLIDLKAIQGYNTFAIAHRERIARDSYFETMKILKNDPKIQQLINETK